MRVLFYTATAFFVALTGLLAFYAFQPGSMGGAKVVLSIDISGMPKEADSQSGSPAFYAEDDAKPGAAPSARSTGDGEKSAGLSADTGADRQFAVREPGATDFGRSDARTTAEPEKVDARAPSSASVLDELDAPIKPEVKHNTASAPEPQHVTSPVVAKPETEFVQTETIVAGKAEAGVPTSLSAVETAAPPALPVQQPQQSPAQAQVPPQTNQQVAMLVPMPTRRPAIPAAIQNGWGTQVTPASAVDDANVKGARVAILIRGLGQDRRDSLDAINKLPAAVSLGFVPNDDGEEMAGKAREAGHEIIVQLPLEPSDYPANNPGPDTLLTTAAPAQNVTQMRAMLGRFKGYTGVTNLMGGKLLQSREAMRPILEDIKARNLVYIGEGNNSHTLVRQIAQELKLRYGNAAVMIDTHPTPDAIKAALDRLVAVAQKRGTAIGIGLASEVTVEQLQAWAQGLAAQGVTLVPVGALAQTAGAS